jgi:uncharacterized phage-associated protein
MPLDFQRAIHTLQVMPYPVKAVANYFLDLAEKEGKKLTPMQLQKLVYFAHGWYLALTEKPLVDEHPEAWPYGPVFPSLYHAFKEYGGGPIQGRALEYSLDVNPATGRRTIFRATTPSLDDDPVPESREYSKSVVKRVWDVYGSWTGLQLSQLSHLSDGPWEATRRANPDRKGSDIADDQIREYFLKKARQTA